MAFTPRRHPSSKAIPLPRERALGIGGADGISQLDGALLGRTLHHRFMAISDVRRRSLVGGVNGGAFDIWL